jgi:hypothetical protein
MRGQEPQDPTVRKRIAGTHIRGVDIIELSGLAASELFEDQPFTNS